MMYVHERHSRGPGPAGPRGYPHGYPHGDPLSQRGYIFDPQGLVAVRKSVVRLGMSVTTRQVIPGGPDSWICLCYSGLGAV